MGLEGFILFLIISVVREDGRAGHRLHVNGCILGVFVPKGGAIILVLRDNHNPDDIYSGMPVTPRIHRLKNRSDL